jgi:hypothetical protein
MSEIKHISPSQIKTWRQCNRKWWYEKVAKIRQPTTKGQQLGTDVHELLEHYVEHGKVLPDTLAGEIARAALPMVNMDAKCEHQFTLPLIDGIVATGRIDFTNVGVIEDLKTTSNMRYAKSSEELRSDPQAIIYLWAAQNDAALSFFGPINKFSHLIVQTKAPHKIRRVDCELSNEDVEQGMQGVRSDALAIRSASNKEVKDLDYNLDACSMFGGCHLRNECLKEGIFWGSPRKDDGMNPLLASLRGNKTAVSTEKEQKATVVQKGPPAPEPEPMPSAVAPGPINPPDGISEKEKVILEEKTTRKRTTVPGWVPDHGGKSAVSLKKTESLEVYAVVKDAIYANGDTLDLKTLYGMLDWSPDDKTSAADIKSKTKELIEALPKGFVPAPPQAPVQQEDTQAPPQTPPQAPVQQEDTQTPPQAPVQQKTGDPATSKGWLFVGCRPVFEIPGCVDMDTMLEPIRQVVIASDKDKRHWLMIQDYGVTGSQRVAVTLKQLIDRGDSLPRAILADYRLPGHLDAITILRPFYNIVESL